jgi:hypothetical protein
MELLVATWTLRVAVVAALAVGGASMSAGAPVVDSVDRGIAAAVLFTFAGRWLVGFLEPPERRLMRMRKMRDARRAKAARSGKPSAAAGDSSGKRTPSTVSRSA